MWENWPALVLGVLTAVLLAVLWIARRVRSQQRMPLSIASHTERRRAQRVQLATPVSVYGWMKGEPFAETTDTLNVSAKGGLISLSVRAVPAQPLILTNLKSGEDSHCRVVRSLYAPDGTILIGFEFLDAPPGFWQVDFVAPA